jgi:hypothetical protein
MAEHDLIGAYVAELRRSLRWRGDVDDLVEEAEDHLRESADHLVRREAGPAAAQRQTIQRFGDRAVVARSHALTSFGGIAMPTESTRSAGRFALVSAVSWAVFAGAIVVITITAVTGQGTPALYFVGALAGALAAGTATGAFAGAMTRAGGLRGLWPVLALVSGLGAVMAVLLAGWYWPLWAALLGFSALVTVVRLHAAPSVGRRAASDWLLVAAWPTGIAVTAVLERSPPRASCQAGPRPKYPLRSRRRDHPTEVSSRPCARPEVRTRPHLRASEVIDVSP